MIPALADVGALSGLANGVQAESAGEFLQFVEILTYRSFGPQPGGFRLAHWRAEFDLNELRRRTHILILQLR